MARASWWDPRPQVRRVVRSRAGRWAFSPFTGQDASAWSSFVHLLELWGRSDRAGRLTARSALAFCLASAQRERSIHRVFALTVVAVADWHALPVLWPDPDTGISFPLAELVPEAGGG